MPNENTPITVAVPVERYEDLIVTEAKYKMLLTVIFSTSEFNRYYPERLGLDEEAINTVVHSVVPEDYVAKLTKLAETAKEA